MRWDESECKLDPGRWGIEGDWETGLGLWKDGEADPTWRKDLRLKEWTSEDSSDDSLGAPRETSRMLPVFEEEREACFAQANSEGLFWGVGEGDKWGEGWRKEFSGRERVERELPESA